MKRRNQSKPKENFLPSLPVPGRNEVIFCALGGIGEIGMNAALYGHDGKWIMVDCGITFADDLNPGVDVIVADMTAARALGENLLGVVITHAHEDHVGGVPYVGPDLGAPVFATPFTAGFLKRKLQDDGLGDVTVRTVEAGGEFRLGPFHLRYLPVPHSVPETQSLAIETAIGTLLHTGDWKMDPDPVVGKGFREERFRKLGDAGVLAMFCDSTNAMVEGISGSESELGAGIGRLIADASGRIVFTCFSSNVARLITICRAAAEQGKHFALVGRSLRRMKEVAEAAGYWPKDLPALVEEDHIGYLPPEQTVIACTGSQGEAQAALARMATGSHPHVTLMRGDTVAYSSRDIPGNERAIGRIRNRLIEAGIITVREHDAHIHVSGHPAREELRRMYGLVRPNLLVPCHGETAHLYANEELAKDCGHSGGRAGAERHGAAHPERRGSDRRQYPRRPQGGGRHPHGLYRRRGPARPAAGARQWRRAGQRRGRPGGRAGRRPGNLAAGPDRCRRRGSAGRHRRGGRRHAGQRAGARSRGPNRENPHRRAPPDPGAL